MAITHSAAYTDKTKQSSSNNGRQILQSLRKQICSNITTQSQ